MSLATLLRKPDPADLNRHKKILLCEDDSLYAEGIKAVLAKNKYVVTVVTDGTQAIDLLRHDHRYSLILCNVQMPTMDGFQVLKHVKTDPRIKAIPFIFLTTVSDYAAMERARELGAVDYFIKAHVDPIQLVKLIAKYA